MKIEIPFRAGEVLCRDVPAATGTTNAPGQSSQSLAPGRWAMSARSTVPFAWVVVGNHGARQVTWGEVIEVPEGTQGAISNASYHNGDIIFAGVGTGVGSAIARPTTLCIPAAFSSNGVEGVNGRFTTVKVDTRLARRAYLSFLPTTIPVSNATAEATFNVYYGGAERSRMFAAGIEDVAGRELVYEQLVTDSFNSIPLGYGSGSNVGSSPTVRSQELRPMALFEYAYVQATAATFANLSFTAATPCFFVMEY